MPMQLPPQLTSFAAQLALHAPFEQNEVGLPHTLLHEPQLVGSCRKSTHVPQLLKPVRHTQLPFEHVCSAVHRMLQLPQAVGVFLKVVQMPVQIVAPHAQAPLTQVSPAVQRLPQLPQLSTSCCSSTHALPQVLLVEPTHWHEPPEHAAMSGHALPHDPQLFGSVCTLVHTPPQMSPGHPPLDVVVLVDVDIEVPVDVTKPVDVVTPVAPPPPKIPPRSGPGQPSKAAAGMTSQKA
jgi:hypothetical protein